MVQIIVDLDDYENWVVGKFKTDKGGTNKAKSIRQIIRRFAQLMKYRRPRS